MPYYPPKPRKRGYYTKRGARGMPRYKKPTVHAASVLQAAVRRAIIANNKKTVETKHALLTSTDGQEIAHNNFVTLTNNLLATTQGITDPGNTNTACRIGDKIFLKGVSLKMMLELNERYTQASYRLLVVRCARGDVPTRATLYNGISGNKMIDTINTERYSILFSKTFSLRANNMSSGVADGAGGAPQPSGYGPLSSMFSRATKIVKVWIPGKKFAKSQVIIYDSNGSQPKFFDYYVLLYAYSNYTTLQDFWNVARVNDFTAQLYFTDQ